MKVIHRFNLNGRPVCGAVKDEFGHLRISATGYGVTCAACGPAKPVLCRFCGQPTSPSHRCGQ